MRYDKKTKPPCLRRADPLIVDRYMIREICKPLVVILAVVSVIFASYSTAGLLAEAASGLLPVDTIVALILLKVVIALEVLLPVALYLSVVLALGRLYTDSEMTAFAAAGIGPDRVVRNVFLLSLVLAAVVASLSLYARPWAYAESYWMKARAAAEFNIAGLQAGGFYEGGQGNRVVFVEQINSTRSRAKNVFIQGGNGDRVRVTRAKEVYQRTDENSGERVLVFLDGYYYDLDPDGRADLTVQFKRFTLRLLPKEIAPLEYRRKAAHTAQLARSSDRKDISELQWRISTPLSAVLLGLLGVSLSRTAPRQGKYAKVLSAVVIYTLYYNVVAMAKTWVETGVVGTFPGIWWVHALMAWLLTALLLQPTLAYRLGRK